MEASVEEGMMLGIGEQLDRMGAESRGLACIDQLELLCYETNWRVISINLMLTSAF